MTSGRRVLIAALALLPFVVAPARARPPSDATAPPAPHRAEPRRVPRASSAIVIDGKLDEPAWEAALRLDVPYEVRPGENLATTIHTEALLTYGDAALYAAFRASDPRPHAIRARLADRDRAFADDFVGLVVDTFNDERRAFEFFVNPLGVQMDLIVDDVSGNEDSSWDAIWQSAGRLTDQGYVVEMAIPYTSLRFQRGGGEQIWGLDVVRVYPRDRRYLLALNPRDRSVSCYLCQLTKIAGFAGAQPGRNLEVTPTLTAIRTDEIDAFPDGRLRDGDVDYEPGITARWGVTPNLVLSGTANPDFSQVEADVAQLDVNERFALFFPEKRPFFLEGADFFDTPLSAVHTRTVADPAWGAKLTGKEGRQAIGAFVAEDEVTNLLLPASEGSRSRTLDEHTLDGVLRYRRDVGQSSAVGVLATLREGDDYANRVIGVDSLLRPTSRDTLRVQLLGSHTEYPEALVTDPGLAGTEFEQPRGAFSDRALHVDYRHATRSWWTRANYRDFGEDFRADLGFQPRVDFRMGLVGGGYTWWGEPGDWYSSIEVGGDWDQTEDQSGQLIEREVESWATVSGPRQSFGFLGRGHRTRAFRQARFRQDFWSFFFGVQPVGALELGLDGTVRDEIDFAFDDPVDPGAARQGDLVQLQPSLRYNLGRRVRIDLSHEYRRLERPEGLLFRANLSQLRLVHHFNVRSFLRAIVQHADVDRNLALYPRCTEPSPDCPFRPRQRTLFGQLLFSYKLDPQTALFVGYSEDQLGLDGISLTRTSRTFFLKLGYAWVL